MKEIVSRLEGCPSLKLFAHFFLFSFFIADNSIGDEEAKRIAESLKVNQSLLLLNLRGMLFLFFVVLKPI
jgi:hypothetical protein